MPVTVGVDRLVLALISRQARAPYLPREMVVDLGAAARLCGHGGDRRMDRDGNKEARDDIAAAKVKVPLTMKKVVDVCDPGARCGGPSQDTVLYAQARFLQIADGSGAGAPAFDRPAPHLVRKPRGFDYQRALETAVDELTG
jgi:hypothetical protein